MEVLLDTHIALWALVMPDKLPESAKTLLNNSKNNIYYSIVSMWEVAIKHKKHPDNMELSGALFMHYCEQAGFKKLPLDERHVLALETLDCADDEVNHNDPFDRILLSQAKADGMSFITHDRKFSAYNEPYVFLV